MCYLTYNLKFNSSNSDGYYAKIKIVKDEIMDILFNKSKLYINEFSKYIEFYKIETLRSDEEYFIELLLLGILKREYDFYTGNINIFEKTVFYLLIKYRSLNLFKEKVDKLRGIMNTKILAWVVPLHVMLISSENKERFMALKLVLFLMKQT